MNGSEDYVKHTMSILLTVQRIIRGGYKRMKSNNEDVASYIVVRDKK